MVHAHPNAIEQFDYLCFVLDYNMVSHTLQLPRSCTTIYLSI